MIRLDDAHAAAVEELLLTDPVVNLYLLGMLDAAPLSRATWVGVPDGDGLRAAALVVPDRIVVPYAPDPEDAAAMGRALGRLRPPRVAVGPREATDALWAAWAGPPAAGRTPLAAHYDQRLYATTTPAAEARPLRRATLQELDVLTAQADAMELEDLGRSPLAEDADAFRANVRRRVEEGRLYVIEEDGEIVFQIHVGTITPWGVMVGGTYVPPTHRGRGLGVAGMRALSGRLLPRHGRITLHVREDNLPAVRAYERVGYAPVAPFRLLRRA